MKRRLPLLLLFLLFAGCASNIQYFNAKPEIGQMFVRSTGNRSIFGIQE